MIDAVLTVTCPKLLHDEQTFRYAFRESTTHSESLPSVGHLRAFLRSWRPNPLGLLFLTGSGTPWDHSLVRKRKFHPILKKLGIPQCGFHAFRHGYATLLDQIGTPMAVRLNRLGHAEAQTTMGYTHKVAEDERKTAEELGKILHVNERNEEAKNFEVRP